MKSSGFEPTVVNDQPSQFAGLSRRSLLRSIGAGAAAVAGGGLLAACGGDSVNGPRGLTQTDIDVLNFALNLEYLEAEFYTYATTGAGIEALGIGVDGTGTAGATTGGAQVSFNDSVTEAVALEIAEDERDHVRLLRGFLGADAVAKPAINLAALGVGFGSENEFLAVARALEDVGVTAYAGAAGLLSGSAITPAAQILAAEAYHAGDIRLQVAQKGIATTPVDSKDIVPPPSGTRYYQLDSDGLAILRTPREVLDIVYASAGASSGGFFPNGLNGNVSS